MVIAVLVKWVKESIIFLKFLNEQSILAQGQLFWFFVNLKYFFNEKILFGLYFLIFKRRNSKYCLLSSKKLKTPTVGKS